MDINEIKNSGILEMYALGATSEQETKLVEEALLQHPELLSELQNISKALENYGAQYAQEPASSSKAKIFKTINQQENLNTRSQSSSQFKWLSGLFILAMAGLGYFLGKAHKQLGTLNQQYDAKVIECDSTAREDSILIAQYEALLKPEINRIKANPTEKYPETELIFFNNEAGQTNYLQIANLPSINANQSYQLWSLKGDQAIPLDVFQAGAGDILEVRWELDSDAYALTIEPLAGSQVPTLDDLIAVIPMA